MDQVKLVEDSLQKILLWYGLLKQIYYMVHYHLKLFKGYLPQILLGPFLNTLSHI